MCVCRAGWGGHLGRRVRLVDPSEERWGPIHLNLARVSACFPLRVAHDEFTYRVLAQGEREFERGFHIDAWAHYVACNLHFCTHKHGDTLTKSPVCMRR